jgi:hypothetical protein
LGRGLGNTKKNYHKIGKKKKKIKSWSRALCLSEMKESLSSSTDFSILDETHLTSWVMWGQSEPIVTNTPSIES